MELGPLMKQIRQSRKITLKALAGRTGLTASLISQVENGKTLPSLGSLRAILGVLETALSDFFRQVERKDHILVRSGEIETRADLVPGLTLALYASKLERNALLSYGVRIDPGAEVDLATPPADSNGERFILVEKGTLAVRLRDEEHRLGAGDSLNFKSSLACRILNPDARRPARFFLNGQPPIFA